MKAIISGTVSNNATYEVGVIWSLNSIIDNKKYAVLNYNTKGLEKVIYWKKGDTFSVEIKYRSGPDAIMVEEIL